MNGAVTSFAMTFSDFNYESNSTDIYDYENTAVSVVCNLTAIAPGTNIAVSLLYIAIFLLAIPGNLIVVLVIVFTEQVLSLSDLYLFHLSVADGLLALTLPLWVTEISQGWVFGNTICKIANLIMEVSFYSSILFLVCISVDRYQVIVHAMESRKKHRREWRWAVCGTVWVIGIIFSVPALYSFTFEISESYKICMPPNVTKHRVVTRILRYVFGFLLPLVVMLVCYGLTVKRLLRTRGFQKQKAMRVIMAVVAAFLVCWTPHHLCSMVDFLVRAKLVPSDCDLLHSLDLAQLITHTLALMHTCVNPILYAFIGLKFRSNMQQLLCWRENVLRGSLSRFSRSTSQTSEAVTTLL
ncbi:C-X-C chemokine receptor type 1 [Scleropages formosus]|uniref:C-X-C chemokine receptor type 1-like n=1 Tax=Scleropages formosus TaxID=113540 RepID=A0A8C9SWL8_SCLFO|nr:C-X-C chemokine receptor type 1-like [Scleropages formosus]